MYQFIWVDQPFEPDDQVRINCDFPDIGLRRGDVGVVRDAWFVPTTAYQIEFVTSERPEPLHALLLARHVEPYLQNEPALDLNGLPQAAVSPDA